MVVATCRGRNTAASRLVPNVCKQIVYACRTMSGRPDMAGRIFTHIFSQIVYKLPEVVRPYRPSRQVATRCSLFVQNVCTKCLDLSGHTGRRGRSEQLVGQTVPQGHQGFCSGHVVPLLCCAVSWLVVTRTSRVSCTVLNGLAQAKIIKKSVILFWLTNMTIRKHVHGLEMQFFFSFLCRAFTS